MHLYLSHIALVDVVYLIKPVQSKLNLFEHGSEVICFLLVTALDIRHTHTSSFEYDKSKIMGQQLSL